MKKLALVLLVLALVIPGGLVLFHKYEGSAPKVDIRLPSLYLKKSYELTLDVKDSGTGLRKIMLSIMQGDKEKILLDKTYEPASITSFFTDNKVVEDSFVIPVESRKYGLKDGDAVIRIMVADYSWHGWNKGNVFYEEKTVIIDTVPPKINVLSSQHNIERGGSGLVVYRLFEDDVRSGVRVGDNFFPGHSGLFEDERIHLAFFALDHTQGPGTRMVVSARDRAGNETKKGFRHYIRDKKFKTDILNISDRFLESKMGEFDLGEAEEGFAALQNPMLEKFLYINGRLREKNVGVILGTQKDTVGEKLWQGRFARLTGAATRSGWADRRIYKYKGREVDRAYHLGMDLASTSKAPVGAANSGRVIFAGDEGIFGNTVVIDHGFGLASLYSHLSSIHVNKGDNLSKGDVLGTTGLTGMAGGDHLHFSMIVHNVFVNPVEWWDGTWIKHNITSKIESVKQGQK